MNPYLARREAKIAANEKRLRELGLLSPMESRQCSKLDDTTASSSTSSSVSNGQSRNINSSSIRRRHASPPAPLRRSKRLRNDFSLPPTSENHQCSPQEDLSQQKNNDTEEDGFIIESPAAIKKPPVPRNASSPKITAKSVSLKPNSAKAIHLDVGRLLFGPKSPNTSGGDGLLGRQLSQTGKAFVMQESARLAGASGRIETGNPNCSGPTIISFNKYSGVQEWGNDVIFLWVNLGAPNCEVVNEFLGGDDGRQITWYGGSRMHDQSPVIQRLIQIGKRCVVVSGATKEHPVLSGTSETNDPSPLSSSGIILWCRRYIASTKCFTPYTCLGRLRYESHEIGSRPLLFVWNLVDCDTLKDHPDPKVRTTFMEMVNTSGTISK